MQRLRDFFRAGTTRLEIVPTGQFLAMVSKIGARIVGERRIVLAVESDADVPDLLADPLQIELVLRNLLANAVESLDMAPGSGNRIRVHASRLDARRVAIVVADNGPGISPGIRERLFEPFASGKASGMGLGLAVSRAIVEAHGGTLDATRGAHGEFRLVLPAATADD